MAGNESTENLMKMLITSPALFVRNCVTGKNDNEKFHEYFEKLVKDKGVKMSRLIRDADLSKTYAYQCIKGERVPGRDIVLRIALVLQLSVKQTNHMLTLAGKNMLYPKNRRDAAFLYCLTKKMSLEQTNDFLAENGETCLL